MIVLLNSPALFSKHMSSIVVGVIKDVNNTNTMKILFNILSSAQLQLLYDAVSKVKVIKKDSKRKKDGSKTKDKKKEEKRKKKEEREEENRKRRKLSQNQMN
jgi:hypothetical protein